MARGRRRRQKARQDRRKKGADPVPNHWIPGAGFAVEGRNQGDQLDREKLEKKKWKVEKVEAKKKEKKKKDHKAQDTREVWARSINQCANPSTRSSVKPSINSPVHQPINRPLRGGEALLGSTIGKESQRDGREEEKEREGEGGEGEE